jgi:hypothetical protein
MDAMIETFRAEKLAEVRYLDRQTFHETRKRCLHNMTNRAFMLDNSLQDVVLESINQTEEIVSRNPGFQALEARSMASMTLESAGAGMILTGM